MKCAYNFTKDHDEAKELLQDVYLYLLEMKDIEKIKWNGELNLLYIYRIIKTKFLTNKKRSISYLELTDDNEYNDEIYNIDEDTVWTNRLQVVQDELSGTGSLHWFDAKLFSVYIDEDHSLTTLAEATKISRSSCWTSISKTKKYLKQRANEL